MQKFILKEFLSNKKNVIILSSIVGTVIFSSILAILLTSTNIFSKNREGQSDNPKQEREEDEYYADTIENDNPTCSLTKIEYPENAFSIGVPNGWLYEVDNGTVSIMEDETNTTSAFLYTAKLEREVTTQEFLEAFSTIFKQTIEAVGGTFQTANIQYSDQEATSEISSKIDSVEIKGRMIVMKSGNFVVFKSYWAPVDSYESKEPLLEEISGCFARNRVLTDEILEVAGKRGDVKDSTPVGLEAHKGKYFKLKKPSNFNVTGETDSGIDLTRNDGNAGFSYAYATGFTGGYTPRSWAERALPEFAKIQNAKITDGVVLPSQISGHSIQEFQFTGNLNSTPVTGKVTVGVYQAPYYGVGVKYSSAFWAIQIATPENWESAKGTLQTIQDSFEIIDIGATRKNTLLPSNRPMESSRSSVTSRSSSYSSALDDESSENWAEGMRGYETVSSPSTGQNYDVPLNSWSSYGPEGAGYYRELPGGSVERLN